jgi:formylglycine-generating enzyme required for sulfatase activity
MDESPPLPLTSPPAAGTSPGEIPPTRIDPPRTPIALPEEISAGLLPHIPGYAVIGELGRGGMGVVYSARQVGLERTVAVKVLLHASHAGSEMRSRFLKEAQAVARLQHANIVQIHEINEVAGLPYFSMEYCPGGSLARRLDLGPLEPREAAQLLRTLALAVQAAHDQQVIHRDLKPANILLTADGTPKVADFGLARRIDEAGQTATGAVLGTPSYMAPEQARGKIRELGPGTDVYSLGAILYECLTGRPPFREESAFETLVTVVSSAPVRPRAFRPELPAGLEAICLRCLQKDPAQRPASARRLAEMLDAFLADQPIPGIEADPPRRPKRKRLPLRRAILLTVACLLMLSVPLGTWLLQGAGSPPVEPTTQSEDSGGAEVVVPIPKAPAVTVTGPKVVKVTVPPVVKAFVNSLGMTLLRIDPGKFMMGSGKEEQDAVLQLYLDDEKKAVEARLRGEQQHEVEITKAYYLGVHEVTQAQYQKVMGNNPSHFSATGEGKDKVKGSTANLPVEMVSWYDAGRFCEKLSEREEEKKAGRVYRLPTEAEWEHACRAGTRTIFHCGDALSSRQGNFDGNYPFGAAEKGPNLEQTSAVGSYKPNAWGLYDMHGNVWEWCSDWYDVKFYQTGQARKDPTGPSSGKTRVLRGGSWYGFPKDCRAAHRNHYAPDSRYNDFGFRIVCDVKATP